MYLLTVTHHPAVNFAQKLGNPPLWLHIINSSVDSCCYNPNFWNLFCCLWLVITAILFVDGPFVTETIEPMVLHDQSRPCRPTRVNHCEPMGNKCFFYNSRVSFNSQFEVWVTTIYNSLMGSLANSSVISWHHHVLPHWGLRSHWEPYGWPLPSIDHLTLRTTIFRSLGQHEPLATPGGSSQGWCVPWWCYAAGA